MFFGFISGPIGMFGTAGLLLSVAVYTIVASKPMIAFSAFGITSIGFFYAVLSTYHLTALQVGSLGSSYLGLSLLLTLLILSLIAFVRVLLTIPDSRLM